MKTITLQIDDKVKEKFDWLLSHFSNDEVTIIEQKESAEEIEPAYEHIPTREMMQIEKEHKEGSTNHKKEFEQYQQNQKGDS